MAKSRYIAREYTVAECAYLAGIIDGEGCIFIGNYSCNPKTGAKHYQTLIKVTVTDLPLIEWLQSTFGGISHTRKTLSKGSRKTIHEWHATGDRVTHLCQIMMPYIIIKKRELEIMLQMRATYCDLNHVKGKQGVQPLSKDILDLRQSLMDELRSLHCRSTLPKSN